MYPQYELMKTMQDERLRAAARDHLAAKARRARTARRDHAAATRAAATARGAGLGPGKTYEQLPWDASAAPARLRRSQ